MCCAARVFTGHSRFDQLEKLLQKNYFLHQSARDGYRSYLQSYASYSLKKIFDVNKLDLAKVGKAFGFAVPPRVNLNMGVGKGTSTSKRQREEENEEAEVEVEVEEMEVGAGAEGSDAESKEGGRAEDGQGRKRQTKQRRMETLGKKRVEREVFRKGRDRAKRAAGGVQWSR